MKLNFNDAVFDSLAESLDSAFPEILDVFFIETEESIKDLKVNIDDENIIEILDIVHKIKSSTKTFGAMGLFKTLEQMEAIKVVHEIQQLYQSFIVEYKLVKDYMLTKIS